MGFLFKDLSPLDSEGIMDHRPDREVKWSKLENVIFKEGAIARRPGVTFIQSYYEGPLRDADYPSVARGLPVAIMEITNPGPNASGREGYKWIVETEVPTANTELVAGWTGDFGDIDEDPGDGVAVMESSTDGAQEQIEFSNLTSDFDAVSHITVRGRARVLGGASPQTLNIYSRSVTTNYLLAAITVYAYKDGEAT